ncbi:heavy metal-associated isoprenylated plant protein 47-like isoform X5 [Diospyros lotus]|uniref:heavy metal-associated isoprenylated plant protein 47-like isoform X1 n=1 Tax=Diospyros lotus TaxID=55363 RepID=UPI0022522DC0|nr:heavy metal-associated isoprenylated plant protein 47-like isoform X1 [Diospyros lotus]XP_052177272.1 heavy metal-associated isoprenylated plant protein 47-like isoform X2 [Diospyros lotus]XP_052177273.1 heavy metal-associated isoprenylated plant protein 47-like isoform X3 [Diospyros lotus]XP_052177274.1 heavy metal-associated isoprenylated plant protein 47-like isoform X4 [Diospyros lotus]XP_052177275.1 heavy metal-associated isoprenylated plant protein 47-like isoform X5 [Diospyros lotus]
MQQRIVIKVRMKCQKCRSKAMTIAASAAGVFSVKFEGEEKDEVVVIGNRVDAAALTSSLRKNVGHATLEKVEVVA